MCLDVDYYPWREWPINLGTDRWQDPVLFLKHSLTSTHTRSASNYGTLITSIGDACIQLPIVITTQQQPSNKNMSSFISRAHWHLKH